MNASVLGVDNSASMMDPVRDRIETELSRMTAFVGEADGGSIVKTVRGLAEGLLRSIEGEILRGAILPWSPLRISADASFLPIVDYAPQIGVYLLTSNPMQWCHILASFSAMASLRLDHVVFIVTEEETHRPSLLPREVRHAMTRDALAGLSPLLLYSTIRTDSADGDIDAFFHFLRLNSRQPMHVHLLREAGSAGFAERLAAAARSRLHGYDSWTHPVSIVRFDCENAREAPSPFPSVSVQLPLPDALPCGLPASFPGDGGRGVLAAIPYSGFRHIRRHWTHTAPAHG